MSVKKYSLSQQADKKISKHFTVDEFKAHDSGKITSDTVKVDTELIKKLEKFFNYGITAVVIADGYRTRECSLKWGGGGDDAHTRGIAADIICYKGETALSAEEIACIAQIIGFSGIGIMDGSCHLDVRNAKNYKNAHWWGDERNGNNAVGDYFAYTNTDKAKLFGKLGYFGEALYKVQAKKKTPVYYDERGELVKKYYEKGKKARVWAVKGKFSKVLSGWVKTADVKKL